MNIGNLVRGCSFNSQKICWSAPIQNLCVCVCVCVCVTSWTSGNASSFQLFNVENVQCELGYCASERSRAAVSLTWSQLMRVVGMVRGEVEEEELTLSFWNPAIMWDTQIRELLTYRVLQKCQYFAVHPLVVVVRKWRPANWSCFTLVLRYQRSYNSSDHLSIEWLNKIPGFPKKTLVFKIEKKPDWLSDDF